MITKFDRKVCETVLRKAEREGDKESFRICNLALQGEPACVQAALAMARIYLLRAQLVSARVDLAVAKSRIDEE